MNKKINYKKNVAIRREGAFVGRIDFPSKVRSSATNAKTTIRYLHSPPLTPDFDLLTQKVRCPFNCFWAVTFSTHGRGQLCEHGWDQPWHSTWGGECSLAPIYFRNQYHKRSQAEGLEMDREITLRSVCEHGVRVWREILSLGRNWNERLIKRIEGPNEHDLPRSSRSPNIVTRSVAERRSSQSMRQQRSISTSKADASVKGFVFGV